MTRAQELLEEKKYSSKIWQRVYNRILVVDPDGWDRKDFNNSWNEQIMISEYKRRLGKSTCKSERNLSFDVYIPDSCIENVHGHTIPRRLLTESESTRKVTLDRFDNYHHAVGEDFVDQHEVFFNERFVAGYILCKYPDWNKELIDAINQKYSSVGTILEVYKEKIEDDETSINTFYSDLSEFINLTVQTKEKVNQVLIQLEEYHMK